MPRRLRIAPGGLFYHALNRAAGRATLFHSDADYLAFERAIDDVHQRLPIRIVGYVIMPNHFHLALWPRADGEISEFMRLLTVTHTNRYHAHRGTTGTGPLYQGRFKSFPVEADEHAAIVLRYIDRNPLRAGLVSRAEQWRWGSLHHHASKSPSPRWLLPTGQWPVDRPRNWVSWVNAPQTDKELRALRECVARGRPFGTDRWMQRTTDRLGLHSAFAPRGRPPKSAKSPPQDVKPS